jgi:cytoplasmic iron level regulating protein YaaA (DUF328/UPF0246 family)
MLFLLSPAKTLDYDTPLPALPHTLPEFAADAGRLIAVLRRKSARQLSALMDISNELAVLNASRYQAWSEKFTELNARQAFLAFDGDVYDGLAARSLAPADLEWAQARVRMLSGLYGVLRPLDWMQPYRLEMGTQLAVGRARNLYQYWGGRIAESLNRQLQADKTPVVINLASQEYFKSVDLSVLRGRVIECVFEEARGDGPFRIVSFPAKKARGMMARFAIVNRIETPHRLETFAAEGYSFDKAASLPDRLVFRRRIAA